jgi:SAM-dependent methyltransferase
LSAHQAAIAGTEGAGRLLLEIGCGERHCEPYFTERGFRYVAVDVDKRGPGPHLMADGHNLPFQDESFDLCYAMAVLQHMSCPWLAVQEAQRVLKAGGVFFGAAAFVSPVSDRNAFFHFSYGGLLCLLRSFGFEKVQIWPAWPYYESIPGLSFSRRFDWPWRLTTQLWLTLSEQSYLELSNATRRLVRKQPLDRFMRRVATAGGLNFAAYKPGSTA